MMNSGNSLSVLERFEGHFGYSRGFASAPKRRLQNAGVLSRSTNNRPARFRHFRCFREPSHGAVRTTNDDESTVATRRVPDYSIATALWSN
jgi:hypothetical protein